MVCRCSAVACSRNWNDLRGNQRDRLLRDLASFHTRFGEPLPGAAGSDQETTTDGVARTRRGGREESWSGLAGAFPQRHCAAMRLLNGVDCDQLEELEVWMPVGKGSLFDQISTGTWWVDKVLAKAHAELVYGLKTTARVVVKPLDR